MITLFCIAAFGADDGAPAESHYAGVTPRPTIAWGFSGFATFSARATATNLDSTNPFLDGQVLGKIGGTNGIVPDPSTLAAFTEQRVGGFGTYRPKVLGGKAGLTGAFEVDFAFGDRSYGTGGNTGGAFGADQVNLQTRRMYADFWPGNGKHDAHVLVGLQFVGDSVNDPTAGGPDAVLRSGGRLMVFGSEAAGIAAYGRIHDSWGDRLKYRLGTFTLYEQAMSQPDDLWLNVADVQYAPAYQTTIGVHAWYLQDRTGGGVGSLGIGPTSALSELQGGPKVDLFDGATPPTDALLYGDIGWLGVDGGYNAALAGGPVGVSGVAILNVGRMYAPIVHDDRIAGLLADGEVRWRYAPGEGSIAKVEALFTSGETANPNTYTGVVTGNSYGFAGAVHATHGMMLLFPDPRSIDRMVAVVSDVSGAGRGVIGLTGNVGYDAIPDRVNVRAGLGTALTASGESWGTEINGGVVAQPLVKCDVGVYFAGVIPGSASGLTASPWEVYASVDWLVF